VRNRRPKTFEISSTGGMGWGGYKTDHPVKAILSPGAPRMKTLQ